MQQHNSSTLQPLHWLSPRPLIQLLFLYLKLLSNSFPTASHPSVKAGPLPPAMPPIPDESSPVAYQNLSSPPDHHLASRGPPHSTPHSREASTVRGRAPDPSVLASSSLQAHHSRRGNSHSKSPETSTGRPAAGYDGGLERRPSNSYGHHRQTSIVHGIQHSRNPSYAASSNPLGPELMASLARNVASDLDNAAPSRPEQPDLHSAYPTPAGSGSSHHPVQSPLGAIEDQDTGAIPHDSSANPLPRKMDSSGKQWREGSHSRSHSKHHSDPKTVGEYALHHLFNSVRRRPKNPCAALTFAQVCRPGRQQNQPGHNEAGGVGYTRRASMRPWCGPHV